MGIEEIKGESREDILAVTELFAETLRILMDRTGVECPKEVEPEVLAGKILFGIEQRRIDFIARVAHEVNRAYCESLGDFSQVKWEDAPEWQRISCRCGVDLHLMGDFGPEASHEAWARQKIANGWVYGPEKDEKRLTHPCLVSFDKLPQAQQAKDFIFRAVVHALR